MKLTVGGIFLQQVGQDLPGFETETGEEGDLLFFHAVGALAAGEQRRVECQVAEQIERIGVGLACLHGDLGKIDAALGEVREAVDYLRYYAGEARRYFSGPTKLPGPTGEANELTLHGKGVFACISPWNFPLAIFTGQVAAALAAGNAVLAKPAAPTPLIAAAAVALLH